jgi:hypothetical protein
MGHGAFQVRQPAPHLTFVCARPAYDVAMKQHTTDILFLVAGLTIIAVGIWIGFEGAPFLNFLSKRPAVTRQGPQIRFRGWAVPVRLQ